MERAAGLAGQGVHAEGAARPDADRLKRVVGFRLTAGAFGAGRAEVYIKARACCGRLRSKGGFGRDRCDGGCVRLPGRCSLLLRKAAGVSNDVIDRMVRPGGGIGQRTGQVLNALLLRCSVEKPGIVGCFSGGALLLALGPAGRVGRKAPKAQEKVVRETLRPYQHGGDVPSP